MLEKKGKKIMHDSPRDGEKEQVKKKNKKRKLDKS